MDSLFLKVNEGTKICEYEIYNSDRLDLFTHHICEDTASNTMFELLDPNNHTDWKSFLFDDHEQEFILSVAARFLFRDIICEHRNSGSGSMSFVYKDFDRNFTKEIPFLPHDFIEEILAKFSEDEGFINPSVIFSRNAKSGKYNDYSDDEYREELRKTKIRSFHFGSYEKLEAVGLLNRYVNELYDTGCFCEFYQECTLDRYYIRDDVDEKSAEQVVSETTTAFDMETEGEAEMGKDQKSEGHSKRSAKLRSRRKKICKRIRKHVKMNTRSFLKLSDKLGLGLTKKSDTYIDCRKIIQPYDSLKQVRDDALFDFDRTDYPNMSILLGAITSFGEIMPNRGNIGGVGMRISRGAYDPFTNYFSVDPDDIVPLIDDEPTSDDCIIGQVGWNTAEEQSKDQSDQTDTLSDVSDSAAENQSKDQTDALSDADSAAENQSKDQSDQTDTLSDASDSAAEKQSDDQDNTSCDDVDTDICAHKKAEMKGFSEMIQFVKDVPFKKFYEEVSEQIIGHKDEVKKACYYVYNYIRSMAYSARPDDIVRNHFIIAGKSGCGKTEFYRAVKSVIAKHLCESGSFSVFFINAASVTDEGYKGINLSEMMSDFYKHNPRGLGIVFLDELDKKICYMNTPYHKAWSTDDFLSMLDGEGVQITSKYSSLDSGGSYATNRTLFIGLGAFSMIRETAVKDNNIIGFTTDNTTPQELYANDITFDKMADAGASQEFLGRFSDVINFSDLTTDEIKKILDQKLDKEFINNGSMPIHNIKISDQAMIDLAEIGNSRRGIRAMMGKIRDIVAELLTDQLVSDNSDNVFDICIEHIEPVEASIEISNFGTNDDTDICTSQEDLNSGKN